MPNRDEGPTRWLPANSVNGSSGILELFADLKDVVNIEDALLNANIAHCISHF